jgi:hypothetical protein
VEPELWISIYLPIFTVFIVIFLIIIPNKRKRLYTILRKRKKRREESLMTNELIKKYLGKKCKVYSGSFGASVEGELKELEDNWLEVSTSKGVELVNIDFIQNIKVL